MPCNWCPPAIRYFVFFLLALSSPHPPHTHQYITHAATVHHPNLPWPHDWLACRPIELGLHVARRRLELDQHRAI